MGTHSGDTLRGLQGDGVLFRATIEPIEPAIATSFRVKALLAQKFPGPEPGIEINAYGYIGIVKIATRKYFTYRDIIFLIYAKYVPMPSFWYKIRQNVITGIMFLAV